MPVLYNRSLQKSLGKVRIADRFGPRLFGLLLSEPKNHPYPLFLSPCGSIHTLGMRYAVDAIFLNQDGEVLKIVFNIPPWRFCVSGKNAFSVIEFFSGQWEPSLIRLGDKLECSRD